MKHAVRLLTLSAVLFTYVAGTARAQAAPHAPTGTLDAGILPSPAVIEQRWGIRILGVRLAAAGNMMDFRYHVVDPAKAAPLSVRGLQPVLVDEASGSKFIVPAPPKTGPLRSTNLPQAGRNYFMFFANPAKYVRAGSMVSVSIGDFRVEHLRVMAESEPFPETPRFDPKRVAVRHPAAPASGAPGTGAAPGSSADVSMPRARPAAVTVPDLTMTDQDGAQVRVKDLIEGAGPVILTFMYTSCATNCPVMAATVARVQRALGPDASGVRFVSVSIDPERDVPDRLREFLATHGAQPGWRFLTGTREQSETIQRAFDVYRTAGVTHPSAYFIRDARSGNWSRIGGLADADVVTGEFRRLTGQDR